MVRTHDVSELTVFNDEYANWIREYDGLHVETILALKERIYSLGSPMISVIMPVYNPNPTWLIAAIESVLNQSYANWELCIADDASTMPGVADLIHQYLAIDRRIKAVFRSTNGHISAASNSALGLATGEFVALLDQDDLLSNDALLLVAHEIVQHPATMLIYSDEDKLTEEGGRSAPYFKPDWNKDLFYSHNMFSHLGVYRRQLTVAVGGFRIGFEGSQDYDLALRCFEKIEAHQIRHIPRVLYHWRIHSESTSMANEAKPYALFAGVRALNEHFVRLMIAAEVQISEAGYRVRYALAERPPRVSLIVSCPASRTSLKRCLASLLQNTCYPDYEVLVTGGTFDCRPVLAEVVEQGLSGVSVRLISGTLHESRLAAINAAVSSADGDIVGLIDGDVEVVHPDWLLEMVSHVMRPEVGVVGARLWSPDGILQHGGIIFGMNGLWGAPHRNLRTGDLGYFGRAALIQSFSAVSGDCILVRKTLFHCVGGFDETRPPLLADIEFCLRLRDAGFHALWTPFAELVTHKMSVEPKRLIEKGERGVVHDMLPIKDRWHKLMRNDPAYSPNLSLLSDGYSLAWPPRHDKLLGS